MARLKKIRKKFRKAQVQRHRKDEEVVELDISELKSVLDKARTDTLTEDEYDKLYAALDTLGVIGNELDKKRVSIQRLRQMLFGETTEKIENVFPDNKPDKPQEDNKSHEDSKPKKPVKGHGRNGANSYTGGKKTEIKHPKLKAGDPCPDCKKGTVYKHSQPARIVRISGYAPLQAQVYELEKLRCNLCGKLFTAPAPEGIGPAKYDARSAAMIALLKYGSGVPFNRLEGLQGNLGIPLPASTQWDVVRDASKVINPVYRQLLYQAAQGKVIHNDDTTMKILNLPPPKPGRKGIFTSGIVSILENEQRIALFFTGHNHAGENLIELLRQRNELLDKPIQMCDALSRNMPEGLKTIVGNCLTHGRRRFVEVANSFPDKCMFVLEILKEVYRNEDDTKGMTDRERLAYHQKHSQPAMEKLEKWLNEQIDDHKVEPNSSLGNAICYMLKHWEKLTLFLRQQGAPLDNNICERALKKAILNRKNAYFYKTANGAQVGDLYMGLIHTCELNKANPFDYMTELQKNKTKITAEPEKWMPWNYRDNLKTDKKS